MIYSCLFWADGKIAKNVYLWRSITQIDFNWSKNDEISAFIYRIIPMEIEKIVESMNFTPI